MDRPGSPGKPTLQKRIDFPLAQLRLHFGDLLVQAVGDHGVVVLEEGGRAAGRAALGLQDLVVDLHHEEAVDAFHGAVAGVLGQQVLVAGDGGGGLEGGRGGDVGEGEEGLGEDLGGGGLVAGQVAVLDEDAHDLLLEEEVGGLLLEVDLDGVLGGLVELDQALVRGPCRSP